MVLEYEDQDGNHYTLAELVKQFPKEWEYALKNQQCFGEMHLVDLLAEASDEFEAILGDLQYYVEPIGSLGDDDLNVLLAPLWNSNFTIMYKG